MKIVHNAIEQFDVQLIVETDNLLSNIFHLAPADAAAGFGRWNRGSVVWT
jgi:6-phosphogluconate dehydrogenase